MPIMGKIEWENILSSITRPLYGNHDAMTLVPMLLLVMTLVPIIHTVVFNTTTWIMLLEGDYPECY